MKAPHVPKYCHHKADDQAVVYLPLGGRRYQHVYLGRYGSPRSRAKYDRIIARWLGGQRATKLPGPGDLTVELLVADYLSREAERKCRAKDPDSGEWVATELIHRITSALRTVVELFGDALAADYGPAAFEETREKWVDQGYTRGYVNSLANCVRAFLGWAVKRELIPSEKPYAIKLIKNYRAGETTAPDNDEVEPAPLAHIRAIQKNVPPVVRDMIEVQLLSGCRPGEVRSLKKGELDCSGPIWQVRRRTGHKTAHHGHERVFRFGPRAQKVLRPYLRRRLPEEYLFSPREAELARLAALGQKARTRAGARYPVSSYGRAVRRACDRLGLPRWHCHQLRHSAGTALCDQFGKGVAQTILGHKTSAMTDRYNSRLSAKKLQDADKAIKKVG